MPLRATVLLISAACGARSELRDVSVVGDSGTHVADDASTCNPDPSTWRPERFRDEGDYERSAVATSGVPWVALKVRSGNVIVARLSIDDAKGIVFDDRIEIPSAPVYPLALDVDDARFVLLTTTGLNWNGDIALWRVGRADGKVTHVAIGSPPADPSFTVSGALGLAGDAIVLAYARVADDRGMMELRNDDLEVVGSLAVGSASFTAVKTDSGVDIYTGAGTRVHAEAGSLTEMPVDRTWQVIGGLSGSLVEMGNQIRLVDGDRILSTSWPDGQISPPAVVRADGPRVVFSLETEISPVVGHVTDAGLEWLRIASTADAPGFGLGLFPVIDQRHLGVFYLGLEIPKSDQPLRYFGLVCE